MNCAQARFLLYAYLDRDMSASEAETLSRHLAECRPCEARARSARGLARVLHSHLDRTPAPMRLRLRLQQGPPLAVPPRYPAFALAGALLLLIVPLASDVSGRHPVRASRSASVAPLHGSSLGLVLRRMTGTLVCLDCEARHEAGLCPLPEAAHHELGLCAEDGQVWRLMSRDPSFTQAAAGQTVTVEGVAFPDSGFLRASRAGY